ncbi:MAG: L,D-transpeptidase family protein [Longimicrobiales bacterium]|nr:L,D-transpeptidase family protein [Longimicrobiales bacterium]
MAVAAVFETSHPYSARTVDSLDLAAFFERYPGYRTDSASVVDFYGRRAMQFAWILRGSLSASAEAFVALAGLAHTGEFQAAAEGPSLGELYEQGFAEGARVPVCDSCAADLELRLTAEFFRLAARRYDGYLSRDLRDLNWFIPRGKKNLSRLLDSLAVGKMDLSAYEPIHPQYQLLKAGIQRTREMVEEPWPALDLPGGMGKVESGDSVEVIGSIRHRLHMLGDLEEDGTWPVYDSTLVWAVERFQLRHGLVIDGIIGPAFLRAINVPLAQRLRTMLINMERLRWVPEEQSPDLLVVNIPEFRLHVYEEGAEVMSMEVVVGANATRTVVFIDTLSQVVFSPTWMVPASITRDEILPAIRRDPDYLRKNNMEIVGGSASDPVIRQRSGPSNALGLVKFLFPNSFNIYMHDTPAQAAFGREARAFSHGCIRLSRPRELAEYLLRDDPDWTPERIGQAMHGGRETTVQLKEKRPVMIWYFTAWVDGEGRLNFRDDVYGHDEGLAKDLFLEPESGSGAFR